MKKLLLIIFAVLMIIPAAAETIDLSSMTYEELVDLNTQLNTALWTHQDFEEVTVPAGVYKIGEHIPAGQWQIYPMQGSFCGIFYGTEINAAGTEVEFLDVISSAVIYSETSSVYDDGDPTYWIITLSDGYYIEFNKSVIFRKPIAPAFKFN